MKQNEVVCQELQMFQQLQQITRVSSALNQTREVLLVVICFLICSASFGRFFIYSLTVDSMHFSISFIFPSSSSIDPPDISTLSRHTNILLCMRSCDPPTKPPLTASVFFKESRTWNMAGSDYTVYGAQCHLSYNEAYIYLGTLIAKMLPISTTRKINSRTGLKLT